MIDYCIALGVNRTFLTKCRLFEQRLFQSFGLVSIAMTCITIAGSAYLFELVFSSYWLGIPVGIMWGGLFFVLHLFLASTITGRRPEKPADRISIAAPFAFRFFFILLFAFNTNFAIQLMIFHTYLDSFSLIPETQFVQRFLFIVDNRFWDIALLSFGFIAMYIIPVVFKTIAAYNKYFMYEKTKALHERQMIADAYEQFKKDYTGILYEISGNIYEFHEIFEDAPFNTKMKKLPMPKKTLAKGSLSELAFDTKLDA